MLLEGSRSVNLVAALSNSRLQLFVLSQPQISEELMGAVPALVSIPHVLNSSVMPYFSMCRQLKWHPSQPILASLTTDRLSLWRVGMHSQSNQHQPRVAKSPFMLLEYEQDNVEVVGFHWLFPTRTPNLTLNNNEQVSLRWSDELDGPAKVSGSLGWITVTKQGQVQVTFQLHQQQGLKFSSTSTVQLADVTQVQKCVIALVNGLPMARLFVWTGKGNALGIYRVVFNLQNQLLECTFESSLSLHSKSGSTQLVQLDVERGYKSDSYVLLARFESQNKLDVNCWGFSSGGDCQFTPINQPTTHQLAANLKILKRAPHIFIFTKIQWVAALENGDLLYLDAELNAIQSESCGTDVHAIDFTTNGWGLLIAHGTDDVPKFGIRPFVELVDSQTKFQALLSHSLAISVVKQHRIEDLLWIILLTASGDLRIIINGLLQRAIQIDAQSKKPEAGMDTIANILMDPSNNSFTVFALETLRYKYQMSRILPSPVDSFITFSALQLIFMRSCFLMCAEDQAHLRAVLSEIKKPNSSTSVSAANVGFKVDRVFFLTSAACWFCDFASYMLKQSFVYFNLTSMQDADTLLLAEASEPHVMVLLTNAASRKTLTDLTILVRLLKSFLDGLAKKGGLLNEELAQSVRYCTVAMSRTRLRLETFQRMLVLITRLFDGTTPEVRLRDALRLFTNEPQPLLTRLPSEYIDVKSTINDAESCDQQAMEQMLDFRDLLERFFLGSSLMFHFGYRELPKISSGHSAGTGHATVADGGAIQFHQGLFTQPGTAAFGMDNDYVAGVHCLDTDDMFGLMREPGELARDVFSMLPLRLAKHYKDTLVKKCSCCGRHSNLTHMSESTGAMGNLQWMNGMAMTQRCLCNGIWIPHQLS